MKAFGLAPEDAEEAVGEGQAVLFDVRADIAPVVEMFLRSGTQWFHCDAGPTGLRYESVLAMMDLYGVKDKQAMLDDLRVMERAAIMAFRQRK